MITDQDVRAAIERSIEGHETDIDVPGVLAEFLSRWGCVPIDDIDPEQYWALVARHDKTPSMPPLDDRGRHDPRFAAEIAASLLGLSVLGVIDARRGAGEDGPRMVTIRLVEHDPITARRRPGRGQQASQAVIDELPPHPTCVETTTIGAGLSRSWVCGPDCPETVRPGERPVRGTPGPY